MKHKYRNEGNITRVKNNLLDLPEVETVSLAVMSQPYTGNNGFGLIVKYKEHGVYAHRYRVEDDFPKIVRLQMLEGERFNIEHGNKKMSPMVITKTLADSLFQDKPAVGNIVARVRWSYYLY